MMYAIYGMALRMSKLLTLDVAFPKGVCRRTYEACHKIPDAGARERELRLIQSKSDIENPDLSLLAISELIE
eukprot:m.54885 g.54885  ORF g.54885 m.54885 type:complete len:72 (-) comp12907_c0_seq1:156-371(-)